MNLTGKIIIGSVVVICIGLIIGLAVSLSSQPSPTFLTTKANRVAGPLNKYACPSATYELTKDPSPHWVGKGTNPRILSVVDKKNGDYAPEGPNTDLKDGEWDGTAGTTLEECKEKAKAADVDYFAWTGAVYNGFCKVLKPSVSKPDLTTYQGYGYQRYKRRGQLICGVETDGVRTKAQVASDESGMVFFENDDNFCYHVEEDIRKEDGTLDLDKCVPAPKYK